MFRASERFVCMVGQHRSTHRDQGKLVDLEEAKLRCRKWEIAGAHIRWTEDGLPLAAAGGLDGEPQAGAPALAVGGPAEAHSQKAEASPAQ